MSAGLAAAISQELAIPTVGIGAGVGCDGQVLVIHDLLGLCDDLRPRFVKRYAELGRLATEAVAAYVDEMISRSTEAVVTSLERADRPVVPLSGGMDSSMVVALMAEASFDLLFVDIIMQGKSGIGDGWNPQYYLCIYRW